MIRGYSFARQAVAAEAAMRDLQVKLEGEGWVFIQDECWKP